MMIAQVRQASPVLGPSLQHPLKLANSQARQHFGKKVPPAAPAEPDQTIEKHDQNAVWLTTNIRLPGMTPGGGLGMVSLDIPEALNRYYGMDVRVEIPTNKEIAKLIDDPKEGWQNTGETITVPVPFKQINAKYTGPKQARFEVFQKYYPPVLIYSTACQIKYPTKFVRKR